MSEPDTVNLEARIRSLETETELLKLRNARVEADKAWEISQFRVLVLVGVTYCGASLVFWLIKVPSPLLSALIPTIGYYLSTLSLPIVKRWWLKRRNP